MPTSENDSTVISFPAAATETTPQNNYDAVRFNAVKHGILSRYIVLSHEDASEYQTLLTALMDEHQPAGATEAHLVEELATLIWRKRRVLMAEGADLNQGLKSATDYASGVVAAAAPLECGLSGDSTDLREFLALTPEEIAEHQREACRDLEATQKAAAILQHGGVHAYDKALRALLPDSRGWWQRHMEEERCPAAAEALAEFIRDHLEPLCVSNEKEMRHHAAIKAQTLGQGLEVYRLEKLMRYETHLDRKFARTLAMLLKLKDLGRGSGP